MKRNSNFYKKAFKQSIISTVTVLLGIIVFFTYTKSPMPNLLFISIGGFCGSLLVELAFYRIQQKPKTD